MRKFRALCASSLAELASIRTLTLCGLMGALAVVLNLTARIDIGSYFRISFSGLANRIVEFSFGPVVGAIFGGAADILNFIVKPTGAFFPGFTFDKMLEGFLFGIILYQKPLKLGRVFLAQLLTKIIVNCGFNTLWMCVMYGQAASVLLPARLIKNAVMLPVDTLITFMVLTVAARILQQIHFRPRVTDTH